MKKSFLQKSMMGLLALAALGLSACAKKEGGAVRVAGRAVTTTVTTAATVNRCGDPNKSWGKIYDQHSSGNFESQVKSFVSATLDPSTLGTISGNINDPTGIDFSAVLAFDSANQLIPASSTLIIKIFDSYAGQVYNGTTVAPYNVEFNAATEGMIDRTTRQIQAKFKDSYGEIIIQGQYDEATQGMVQGTVYYTNFVAVTGHTPTNGTLGSFRSYACAMIK